MICPDCHKEYHEGQWPWCDHGRAGAYWRSNAAVHTSERPVVFEHPGTGDVKYPGRSDTPMPARYAAQGYVRRELSSLAESDRFCKQHGVVNEMVEYGRHGNETPDATPTTPDIRYSNLLND